LIDDGDVFTFFFFFLIHPDFENLLQSKNKTKNKIKSENENQIDCKINLDIKKEKN